MTDFTADIDSLWDYNDPTATEARFRQLLSQLVDSPDKNADKNAELLTQIARTQGLQGHFAVAHATLDEVERSLKPQSQRTQIRYHLERGRVYNSSGHADAARSLFLAAWELASKNSAEEALAIDAAHMMAIVEPPDKQLEWNLQALAMAEVATDPKARRWQASLYNNIGWSYHEQGKFAEALAHFQKALIERQAQQNLPAIRVAQWCVGRALRSLNQIDAALDRQKNLLTELTAAAASDGFVFEEIGECLLLQNKASEAAPYFVLAHQYLSQDPWLAKNEPARLERMLDLSNSCYAEGRMG